MSKKLRLDHSDVDDVRWAKRSSLWLNRVTSRSASRAKRERPRNPLVLAGHGVSLRIENGVLTIKNGFTHYPQKKELFRFFKGELDIPERIIMLDGSGSISFDVLSWLSEQGVSLVQISWNGEVQSVASPSGYSANSFRVNWQIETRNNSEKRMEFSISNITQKIENSISTLEKAVRRNDAWNKAIEIAYSTLTKLDEKRPNSIPNLRTLEANAAAAYFRAWRGIPIKWRARAAGLFPNLGKQLSNAHQDFTSPEIEVRRTL